MRASDKILNQKDVPEICSTIIEESRRLERMVIDAAAYSDMYQKEAKHSVISLISLISGAVDKLPDQKKQSLAITKNIYPDDLEIHGDRNDLEIMFTRIIQHCLDSAAEEGPDIIITARLDNRGRSFVEIEISSKGSFQNPEELRKNFVPFYSTRPDGTGFGLSIARLAANKSLGDIAIDAVAGEGIRYRIKLPVPAKDTQTLDRLP